MLTLSLETTESLPPPNGGFTSLCSLLGQQVKVLATLSKTTKAGVSTWDFVQQDDGKFAAVKREPQVKDAKDNSDLRSLYSSFLKYGFTPVTN